MADATKSPLSFWIRMAARVHLSFLIPSSFLSCFQWMASLDQPVDAAVGEDSAAASRVPTAEEQVRYRTDELRAAVAPDGHSTGVLSIAHKLGAWN